MNICLVEDCFFKNLYPLTKTRPSFGLRCGRFSLEERIIKSMPCRIDQLSYLLRPELEEVWKLKNNARGNVTFDLPADDSCLILNGRALFDEEILKRIVSEVDKHTPSIWITEDSWTAIYLPRNLQLTTINELIGNHVDLSKFPDQKYLGVPLITYPWDLIRYNSLMLRKDFSFTCDRLTRLRFPPLHDHVALINSDQLVIGRNSEIYPFVTIDCSRGPVMIGDNVKIESGAFIQGPAFIGDNCLVSANTKIYRNSSLGNTCKVGGEVSHSIIHGFSNKRHSGFLGNAYIGEWVNLGAGTNNSNMKNNYNKITVNIDGKEVNTGSQFIGLFMGDHSRTAIDTQFDTATFAGVGCNIFGNGIPPKRIEDFTWGGIEDIDLYDFKKFVENANRMMIRRERELDKEEENLLKALHECRTIMSKARDVQSNGKP